MNLSGQTIVAATRNEHKIREIDQITSQFGMKIISRDDAGIPPVEIVEDSPSPVIKDEAETADTSDVKAEADAADHPEKEAE